MSLEDVRGWFVHLRLGFQILLSPIFLWGYLIAGGGVNPTLVAGLSAFHVFGYAGGTAFNSYYDRDTGPIGGLEHPPPVTRGLLPFSILWQLLGLALAFGVNPPCALIYLAMFWLSIAYSHPRTRLKARPLAALGVVAVGQGILGFLGGWTCAGGDVLSVLTPSGLLGVWGATLLTVGLYPLTEIYQIDEDTRRGDLTLAAWLGPAASFRFALVSLALGGVGAVAVFGMQYGVAEAALLTLFLCGIECAVWRWSRSFKPQDVLGNFRTVMRLYALLSIGFIAWISLHLTGIL